MRKVNIFSAADPSSEQLHSFRLRADYFSCVRGMDSDDNAMCRYRSCIWSGARLKNLLQFFGPPSLPRLCLASLCCCCCCCCIVALSLLWTERPRGRTPFSWSLHTFTALTDIQMCTHISIHSSASPLHSAILPTTRTNTNTLQCGPLSSPCLIRQAINSPSLRNLSQTPHMPPLSSHNGALPAHMPLSITQKCHTAGVTRQIHHFNPFFFCLSLSLLPLHVHGEADVFDLQGYWEKKRHCGRNRSLLKSAVS